MTHEDERVLVGRLQGEERRAACRQRPRRDSSRSSEAKHDDDYKDEDQSTTERSREWECCYVEKEKQVEDSDFAPQQSSEGCFAFG